MVFCDFSIIRNKAGGSFWVFAAWFLRGVVDKKFEEKLLVYGAYLQVCTALQHSNRIQLTYKTITSMWVIATFIGAGYALSTHEVNLPVHSLIVVAMLCLASSLVIILIWYLDLIVQEKNIASAVQTGIELEENNPWLPQVYHNVKKLHYLVGYILMKSVFYIGILMIQLLAITASVGFYLYLIKSLFWPVISGVSIAIIPIFFVLFTRLTTKTDPYDHIHKNGSRNGK